MDPAKTPCAENPDLDCLSRRKLLLIAGAGAMSVALGEIFPGRVFPQDADTEVLLTNYPRKKIAQLSQLEQDKPIEFLYPDDGPHAISFLVKLGQLAGGGLGPDQDIVAFNALCTHQGGIMRNSYKPAHKLAGPCPLHLTSFDLTRHGIVIAGHATDNLPQIVLELDGDEIVATGVLGLIYGYPSNTAFV